jgi:parallel beta-helix repeat protein
MLIKNFRFNDSSGKALDIHRGENISILNCSFERVSKEAVYGSYTELFINDCTFRNNSLTGLNGHFYLNVVTGEINNSFINFSGNRDIYVRSTKGFKITNNIIGGDPSTPEAIYFYGVDDSYITNNKFYYHNMKMIYFWSGCKNNVIDNNTFVGQDGTEYGLMFSAGDNRQV